MLHGKPHRTLSQAPMPNDRTLRPDQRRTACGRIRCPGAVWHGTLCRGERLSATNMILGREFRGRLVRMRATNRLQSEWGARHCAFRKGRRSRPARPANSVGVAGDAALRESFDGHARWVALVDVADTGIPSDHKRVKVAAAAAAEADADAAAAAAPARDHTTGGADDHRRSQVL